MHVVQVCIGNCKIVDVLLDGGFKVNIIYEHLQRKLNFKKLHSMPFMVRMAYQRKVQLMGLI